MHSVIKAKDPEEQLARWIEFLTTFDFEIQHRRENDTKMLMHFPVDPVMTVAGCVRAGNFRNKCLLVMSLTRTMGNQQNVNVLLVSVVPRSG